MVERGTGGRVVVCTVIAKNYLHYARTLMASLRRAHPDWRRVVLLVDELDGAFDPRGEAFEVLEVSRLPLPEPKKFLFRYTILEASTAVKPWLLGWLFRHGGADRVVYLDPDVYVYRPLEEVRAALDGGALLVLTPHLTRELEGRQKPNEHDILKAGCFNLGFIALGRHRHLDAFLGWWQRKLEYDCRVDFPESLFVDQKWLDLAPGMFPDIHVLRHEGYNVAYWNLAHRRLEKRGDGFTVNGRPLVFFHFSGLNPQAPESFSRHQDRFQLDELGAGTELVTRYCREVIARGLEECRRWPYAYGHFRDGSPVLDLIRVCYRTDPRAQERAGEDPFVSDHAYFNEPWGSTDTPLVTNLMRALWWQRLDLRIGFPDADGADRRNFVLHFLRVFAPAEGIPERFVAPVAASYERLLESERPPAPAPEAPAETPPAPPLYRRAARRGLRLAKSCARPVVRRLLSAEARRRLKVVLKRLILGVEPPPPAPPGAEPVVLAFVPRPEPVRPPRKRGLNIVGYVRSEHGLGESARCCARAAEAVALPFSVHDFNANNCSRTADPTWANRLATHNAHWVNLLHVNADQVPVAHAVLGADFFAGHYNIGFWHWELPEFPDAWLGSFDLLDEVWVPTRFVQEAVSRPSPLPVVRMPHAICFRTDPRTGRPELGLPAGHFLFLTMYDTHSFQVRKNPAAVVTAFRKAFPDPRDVALVVKINNPGSYPGEVGELKASLAGVPGVVVIDEILSRQRVYDLEGLCDCFVSLHRAEGFGLGLAESMYLGKPVIGTNWSANTDFMTADNSCPVDYRLVTLDRDYGPYRRGQVWADPDVEHAAWYMRQVVADGAWRRAIAARGRHTIRTELSPQAVGRRYQARLRRLWQLHMLGKPGAARAAA